MRKNEKTLLMQYLFNMQLSMEREQSELVNNIRYRRFDCVDLLELMLLQERLQTFKAVRRDILYIVNMKKYSDDEKNTV
jgi:hypothetical protein